MSKILIKNIANDSDPQSEDEVSPVPSTLITLNVESVKNQGDYMDDGIRTSRTDFSDFKKVVFDKINELKNCFCVNHYYT